jgi:transposase InsO family protein
LLGVWVYLEEAAPFDQLPRYLLRDRDTIFGNHFREQVRDLGISEVLSAPRSPWQRAYIERVIGTIRRECGPGPLPLRRKNRTPFIVSNIGEKFSRKDNSPCSGISRFFGTTFRELQLILCKGLHDFDADNSRFCIRS